MATRRAAIACRYLSRLLLSSSAAASPRLLGYFHQPGQTKDRAGEMYPIRTAPGIRFEPLDAASPRLSLDFLPADVRFGFNLADSHLGLLLLRRNNPDLAFVVCDPVSRRHAILPPLPASATTDDGWFHSPAILSRAAGGRFEFDAVVVTIEDGRPRPWVASFRDGGGCSWLALPPSSEMRCVHAVGSIYWHICGAHSELAMDMATMEFSLLRAPTLIWDDRGHPRFRVGETPDGRLCVASLDDWKLLRVCVRGQGSRDGWVLERDMCLRKLLEAVPGIRNHPHRKSSFAYWLSDIDPGAGRVLIRTMGCGRFSYHMDTGELSPLMTDDGLEYGDPTFAYFAALDVQIELNSAGVTYKEQREEKLVLHTDDYQEDKLKFRASGLLHSVFITHDPVLQGHM
ncbi:hypothetical protein EJB05_44595, partial [Eragrostis curvula]